MSDSGDDGASHPPETTPLRHRTAALEVAVEAGGSAASSAALVRAAEQSRLSGLPLRIVYRWQLDEPTGPVSESFLVASAADARARATRWVSDTLGESAATLRWLLELVEQPPGPTGTGVAPDNMLELSS